MIPYFQFNHILFGSIVIQVWGLWVASGIIAGVLLATYLARKLFLSEEVILDATIWMLVSGLIFARIFHVVFYNLDYYLMNPSQIVRFWEGGSSSLGGFFGAFLAFYLFVKWRKFSFKEIVPYMDVMSLSLWLGWGIGRIGCFFIHDLPGKLTDFFLAVNFPAGARHDLGLYESILAFVIFAFSFWFYKKTIRIRWGLLTLYSWLAYAVVRFGLDFLRATDLAVSDARYFSLTPAQWGMIVVVIGLTGLIIFDRVKQLKKEI